MAGKMSDVEYTVMDNWYRLLNNEIPESPTGFDLSADLIGELISFKQEMLYMAEKNYLWYRSKTNIETKI